MYNVQHAYTCVVVVNYGEGVYAQFAPIGKGRNKRSETTVTDRDIKVGNIHMQIIIKLLLFLFIFACTHQSAFAASKFEKPQTADFSNEDVIDGFNKTVFGSEYRNRNKNFKIHVKKFRKPIRLYVNNFIGTKYKKIEERIRNFVVYIPYANIKIVKNKSKANAFIHLFPNDDKKVGNYLGALSLKGKLSKHGRRNVENFQCAL